MEDEEDWDDQDDDEIDHGKSEIFENWVFDLYYIFILSSLP